jgi:hypothetical protein
MNPIDLNFPLPSPANTKNFSTPFINSEIHTASTSPKMTAITGQLPPSQSRTSTRLRQLLANKFPSTGENPTQTIHYHPDDKLDELLQDAESPTSTHLSPSGNELKTPAKRRRKINSSASSPDANNSVDALLKKILGRQGSSSTSPVKTESNHSDDSSSNGQASNKQRSDIFLRVNEQTIIRHEHASR